MSSQFSGSSPISGLLFNSSMGYIYNTKIQDIFLAKQMQILYFCA
jgi:hypothetical protein